MQATATPVPVPGAVVRPERRERPDVLPLAVAARWAALVAAGLSTQYLFQPFVWANWPVADVLLGWLDVLRDRLVVAMSVALALAAASRVVPRRRSARAAIVAVAIVLGALAGELALWALGSASARTDAASVAGGAIQWTGLALCAAGYYLLWRREREAAEAVRASLLQKATAESLRVRTELEALRQQIEPHFLFNTLATIRHLREASPEDGRRLLRHLAEYVRLSGSRGASRSTLGDEVDLVTSYLAIVAVRMSGRLITTIDVADGLRTCECPPLVLATLVENAVRHGIAPSGEPGSISVSARRAGDELVLVVADTGVGILDTPSGAIGGAGIGLSNTRARLRALYGDGATLRVVGNDPRGVQATIRIPVRMPRP